MRKKLSREYPHGLSMMEIIAVLGIGVIISIVVGSFSVGLFRYYRTLADQLDAENQLRKLVSQFTREVRTSSISSIGAYPIDSATATSFIFYSNIDSDNYKERVRYFLSGTTLRKGKLKPSGTPLTYNPNNEIVVSLVQDVKN